VGGSFLPDAGHIVEDLTSVQGSSVPGGCRTVALSTDGRDSVPKDIVVVDHFAEIVLIRREIYENNNLTQVISECIIEKEWTDVHNDPTI
jgi:hypothetical protein